MDINRRDFIKLMGGTAAAISFPAVILNGCKKEIQKASKNTSVIWIQAQSCSGCSVSLLNSTSPDIASVLTEHISLNFHQTLMGGMGDTAISVLEDTLQKNRKDYILIVEGSIPTKSEEFCTLGQKNGKHYGVREWIEKLAENAMGVIAVGTCATYGGIPAAEIRATGENPTGAKPLSEIVTNKKIINVPGCPPHPDWIVGTLVHVLLKGTPKLDEYNRPLMYFAKTVHEQCEHLKDYKRGRFAKQWGDDGCLYMLGCLGMDSCCDIPERKWVGGNSTCTGCGSGCIGCTEDVFPDTGNRGIYKHLQANAGDLDWGEPRVREVLQKLRNGGIDNG